MIDFPAYEGQLSNAVITTNVLAMVPKELMEKQFIMPLCFDEKSGVLTIVSAKFIETFSDIAIITDLLKVQTNELVSVDVLAVSYENFTAGYNAHYKQQFTPAVPINTATVEVDAGKVSSEQTKLADEILQRGIEAKASDIHIVPLPDGANVRFRIDGKVRDSGIILSIEDEVMISNIYKRNAKLEVNNLVGQDGRFTFLGRDFRLSTQPYGGDAQRNKVVLRIIGSSDNVADLEDLGVGSEELDALRRLINTPSGIILVCGPTGQGKSTTLYSCIKELAATTDSVIVTVEDPIEKYIAGVAQTQVRYADSEKNSLTFEKVIRSMLRQDPDIIMVGEIRDKETSIISVQASQTGHLILSTLHVRSSISVFSRLEYLGANVGGFTEQLIGITSQRLLSVNCPHCRKKIVSRYNHRLRKSDLELLGEGSYSYVSDGCDKCEHTGFLGRVPVMEVIEFNNKLRDYFSKSRGLVETEKYLRKEIGFKSLWDKGMKLVSEGTVSIEELLRHIVPDEELPIELEEREEYGYIGKT